MGGSSEMPLSLPNLQFRVIIVIIGSPSIILMLFGTEMLTIGQERWMSKFYRDCSTVYRLWTVITESAVHRIWLRCIFFNVTIPLVNNTSNTHLHAIIRPWIWFWCNCLSMFFVNRYIEVKFDVRYFQWYLSSRSIPIERACIPSQQDACTQNRV